MNFLSNRGKNGLWAVLLLLVLSLGVFGHPADPSGLLTNYSWYASNNITTGNRGISSGDTTKQPNGWLGTGASGKFSLNTFTVNGIVKTCGELEIRTGGGATNFFDTVMVNKGINASGAANFYKPTYAQSISGNYTFHSTNFIGNSAGIIEPQMPDTTAVNITNITGNTAPINGSTLPPGNYGDLSVNSVVYFEDGIYNFTSIKLDWQDKIIIRKPKGTLTRILVQGNVNLVAQGASIIVDTSNGDSFGSVLVYSEGDSSNMDASAGRIDATFLAPYAGLHLGDDFTINGQIIAKDIYMDYDINGGKGTFIPFDPTKISLVGAADFRIYEDNNGIPGSDNSRPDTIPVELAAPMKKGASVDFRIKEYQGANKATVTSNGGGDIDTSIGPAVGSGTLTFTSGQTIPNERIVIWNNDDAFIPTPNLEADTEYVILELFNPDTALLAADNSPNAEVIYKADGKTVDTLRYKIPIINDDRNSKPIVNDINITVIEGGDTTFKITNFDPDLPGDTTKLSIYDPANFGTVSFNKDSITYTHNNSENFTDQFQVIVTDKADAKDTFTVNVTIIQQNDQWPIGRNDTIVVYEEGDTNRTSPNGNLSLLSNGDHDPESYDSVSLGTIIENGNLGSLSFVNTTTGTFIYTHTSNSETEFYDTVTYTIKDGANHLDTVKAFIRIIPINDNTPTVLNNVTINIPEDTTVSLDSANGLIPNSGATDADLPNNNFGLSPLEKLSVIAHSGTTSKGIFVINADGSYSYTANDESFGLDSIPFIVQDNNTPDKHSADTAYLIVNIIPENDNPPISSIGYINVDENSSVDSLINGVKNVLHNSLVTDADLPNDSLYVSSSLSFTTVNGIATFTISNDGTFLYEYTADTTTEIFTDTVKYTVSDKNSKHSTEVTIIVTINPVNDNNPQAADDLINLSAIGDSTTVLATGANSVLFNDDDIDNPDSLIATLIEGAQSGVLTLFADGTFKYVHDGSADTTDSAFYEVTDGAGHKDTALINIVIGKTFDNAPTTIPDTIVVDEGGTAVVLKNGNSSVTDNDNANDVLDQLIATVVDSPSFASSFSLNPSGTFSYTHNNQEEFVDSFTYLVTDLGNLTATGKVYIIINPINDNSPEPTIDTLYVMEGGSVDTTSEGYASLLTNDDDEDLPFDSLFASLKDSTSTGSILVNSDGTFLYTHNGAEVFTDQFSYTVYDSHTPTPHSKVQVVDIIIIASYDEVPITSPDTIVINEGDTTSTLANGATNLLLNDNDNDSNDTLTVGTILSGPFNGNITIDLTGEFQYIHDDSENFADSVIYTVIDKGGNIDTSILIILINPINDNAPIAVNDSIIVYEGGDTSTLYDGTLSILTNDSDIDINSTLTVSILDSTIHGIFVLDEETGTFTYYHDNSENFKDSLSYIVTDGLFSDTAQVNIYVIPVNDNLPIVFNDTIIVFEGDSATTLHTGAANVLANDTDIDGMTNVIAALTENVILGSLTLNPDGTFKYIHNGTENYHDEFKYVAVDEGDTTLEATVTILITPIPKPSLINAASYYDVNGDGIVDSLFVEFTRPIVLEDSTGNTITSFQIKWDTLAVIDLVVDSSNFTNNNYVMAANLTSYFGMIKTSGTMYIQSTFTLFNPVNSQFFDTTVAGLAADKAAPVITRAEYFFRKIDNPADLTGADSLKFDALLIDFSEPVGAISGNYPFNFHKNNSTQDEYQMELEIVDLTETQGYFKVLSLKGAYYPDLNDSTWIYADSANYPSLFISDVNGNRQVVSENRKVPLLLKIEELDITVKILHLTGKTKPVIPDQLKVDNVDFTTGAVLVLTSENLGNTQQVIDQLTAARKQIGIYDLVGNEVIAIENEGKKHLLMGIKVINGKPSLVINWDGKNSNGRAVATGSYVIILRISGVEMFQDKEEINKINIKQYTTE